MQQAHIWWMTLVRGIALLLLGILAIAWPGITFVILAYLFALYVLIAGVINIIHGIIGIGTRRSWFLSIILGIAEIAVSIYILRVPVLTVATFAIVIGITFIVQGVWEIIIAFSEEDTGTRALDIIGGVLAILAGFFILRYPVSGGIAFVWILGVYGIIVGSIRIATALNAYVPKLQRASAKR